MTKELLIPQKYSWSNIFSEKSLSTFQIGKANHHSKIIEPIKSMYKQVVGNFLYKNYIVFTSVSIYLV